MITAHFFGIGAMIALFLIYQQKNRKNILICKLTADIFWVIHYLCIGGYAGAISNFIGIFRELVFVNRNKYKWANCVLWVPLFIIINLSLGLRTFGSFYNILPITSSAFVTVSLWINNPKLTKIISIPVTISFFIYDIYVHSTVGAVNELVSILSILIFFIKERKIKMFLKDFITKKELIIKEGSPIKDAPKISINVSSDAIEKGNNFAKEITDRFVSDFEKNEDKMAHVSTFIVVDDVVYMTYYANTKEPSEDPKNQTARLVYAPMNDIDNKTFIDLQTTGDRVGDKTIDMVYDTILVQKDDNTLFVMWTASADNNYYRFYCPFNIREKKLGEINVNRFKVGAVTNDFSITGIKSALSENEIPCKKMYSDIGIMQKLSTRVENGIAYYYTGTYSGDFNCVIKSSDLITWEYVSQPDFVNDSKWENAVYVIGDKCYYFVRQQDTNRYGFLTCLDLTSGEWDSPLEVEDSQSRGDFIYYNDGLYLFHAPINREHIGILKIDTDDIQNSSVLLQAKMDTSCFYPFVQYYKNGELAMSYTVARKHIRLAEFTLSKYL